MISHSIITLLALSLTASSLPHNTYTTAQPYYPSTTNAWPTNDLTAVLDRGASTLPLTIEAPTSTILPVLNPTSKDLPYSLPAVPALPSLGSLSSIIPVTTGGLPISIPSIATNGIPGSILPTATKDLPISTLPTPIKDLPISIYHTLVPSQTASYGNSGEGNPNVGNTGQNACENAANSGEIGGDYTVEQAQTTCGNSQLNCCNKVSQKGDTTNSGVLGSFFGSGDLGVQCTPVNIAAIIAGKTFYGIRFLLGVIMLMGFFSG